MRLGMAALCGGSPSAEFKRLGTGREKARAPIDLFSFRENSLATVSEMSRSISTRHAEGCETGWQEIPTIVAGVEFGATRMSIADHFQHAPDAGFVRNFDGDAARRQFRVSMVLVVVIAAAAAALGWVVRFDSPVSAPISLGQPVAPPHYAGRL